jgi:methylglyoxal synthase
MNIALMAHDRKKELMVQFCIAYCGILSGHSICATDITGRLVAEATGLPVTLYLSRNHGSCQQIGSKIAYNEIDLVLFFCDATEPRTSDVSDIARMCDLHNIRLPLERRHGRSPYSGTQERRPWTGETSLTRNNCPGKIRKQDLIRSGF